MNCFKTLFLLSVGYRLSSCSRFLPRTYYYIEKEVTWTEAQHLCRENYTDLATFTSMDDINSLEPTFDYLLAWIGLRDDPQAWKVTMANESNSWRWSATGEPIKTGYSNWMTSEPQYSSAKETCAAMINYGKWADAWSAMAYYFICYTATNENERTYVLIQTVKSWGASRDYCRAHYTDLAMIDNDQQNTDANIARAGAQIVWIGLYREPWAWSDKSQSSFTNWDDGSPNNNGGDRFCAVENPQHKWSDESCGHAHPFICHQVSRLRKMLRVEFHTDADVSDPAVSAQILQKLSAALADEGWTDVSLKWRIQPKKLGEDGAESKETGGKTNDKGPPGQANKN